MGGPEVPQDKFLKILSLKSQFLNMVLNYVYNTATRGNGEVFLFILSMSFYHNPLIKFTDYLKHDLQ